METPVSSATGWEFGTLPPLRDLWHRGWRKLCPCCGRADMFASFFRMRNACSDCGWIFSRETGAITGPMYVNAVVSESIALLILLPLLFWTELPPLRILLVGEPLVLVFALWFFPLSKSLWAAVDYWTDFQSGEALQPDYPERAFTHPAPASQGASV